MSYQGKVRIFVMRNLEENCRGHDVSMEFDIFPDNLISNAAEDCPSSWLEDEIHMAGWDVFEEYINISIEQYQDGDIIEILADAHLEVDEYGWEIIEYDVVGWFDKVHTRKLSEKQARRFCPDLIGEPVEESA